jgi:hypothetical protein
MKHLKLFEYVTKNQQLKNIIDKFSVAPLYHAIKSDRAIKALEENKLGGYSIQRTWEGGKRLKDDQPGYEESNFMRGISTSRDIDYCARWNDVIFIFDQDKLKNKYKVVPYNWGYSIGRGYKQGSRSKREREEFVITGFSEGLKNNDRNLKFMEMINKPEGYIEPLDKYLIGFFISDRVEKYIDEKDKTILKSHKKYLGVYEN